MTQDAPAVRFLRALAAAALREAAPDALAGPAAQALGEVLAGQKSLILDVQFTGFSQKGTLLGGVDPQLLRAAGHLITLRLNRVGLTADAGEGDLRTLFEAIGANAADLGADGVIGVARQAGLRGVYLSTTSGEVYRPAPRAPSSPAAAETTTASEDATATASGDGTASPSVDETTSTSVDETTSASVDDTAAVPGASPAADAAPSTARSEDAQPAGGFDLFGGDDADLSDFELLDDFPALGPVIGPPPRAPSASAPSAGDAAPPPSADPGGHEMYHFFRTVKTDGADEDAGELPGLLRAAENPTRFDELAEAATRAAQRLLRTDDHAQAVAIIEALVAEAERPDRTRIFRESAAQAVRRIGTVDALQHLSELLKNGGQERDRILHLFGFLGGDAMAVLENQLFRVSDAELRQAIFLALSRVEGAGARVIARAMADPSSARTRQMLELAASPRLEHDVALRWLADAAQHADPTVRGDAAKLAAVVGGRGGLRVLLDLINDRDGGVRRAAVQYLGSLGDAAAVPFLNRVVAESGDEELQLAAIATLGKLGSADALPALLGVVNKRAALFSGKKSIRAKAAAIAAIGRIPTPAAREVLASIAAGRDSDLAPEAQRALSLMD